MPPGPSKGSITLKENDDCAIYREGRFVVCTLKGPHSTLTTCHVNGGYRTHLKWLVNHQSCEGKAHDQRHDYIVGLGQTGYHTTVCDEVGLNPEETALMSTAAEMQYAAVEEESSEDLSVLAVVTAGVEGNAGRAGDPARYDEKDGKWGKVQPISGTINTMLLVNCPLTEAAIVRAVATMTEAKSAALEELSVGSRYSTGQATGTGTDQFCIAAPTNGQYPRTWTGKHTRVGELIGRVTKRATREALRWQNGLELSHTRDLFHILRRFGLDEEKLLELFQEQGETADVELLRNNLKSVRYDPRVACCAFAVASIFDKVQHGVVPDSVGTEQIASQCALLVCGLANRPDAYAEYRSRLISSGGTPLEMVSRAVVVGWQEKWRGGSGS